MGDHKRVDQIFVQQAQRYIHKLSERENWPIRVHVVGGYLLYPPEKTPTSTRTLIKESIIG